jgi:RHS repeat-associated protein
MSKYLIYNHVLTKNKSMKKIKNIFLVVVFSFVLGLQYSHAQQYSISGPTSVNQGETALYQINGSPSNTMWQLMANRGTIISSNNWSATITWTTPGVEYMNVSYKNQFGTTSSISYSVTVNTVNPSVPSTPIITNRGCGQSTLSRNGTPPTGVTWYWQGKDENGTSTSKGSGSTFIANEGSGVYYIRAKNNSAWSTSSAGVFVDLNTTIGVASGSDFARCGSGTVTLTATPGTNGNAIRWYSESSGGTLLYTGTSYTSPSLSSTVTYYAESYNSSTECTATSRKAINAVVNLIPSVATGSDVTRCGSGTVILTATPGTNGNTIRWYSNSSGGTLLYTGTSYTTPSLSSTATYYAESYNSSTECTATSRKAISAVVNLVPSVAMGSDVARCDSGTVILTATPGTNGNTIHWYSDSSGGTLLYTGSSYTTPSLSGTTSYYAESYNSSTGCTATTRKKIQAVINTPPTWYADTDTDGYGNAGSSINSCTQPLNYVSNSSDYDDSTKNITNIQPQYFYEDADGDGFGDPNSKVYYSVIPSGYVTNNTDACLDEAGTHNGCIYTPATFSDENYIYTRVFQQAIDSETKINHDSDIIESITYFDGLGRPMQSIGIKASPDKKDIITHVEYDDFGRQDKDWLPYYESTGSVGSYRGDKSLATQQYYQSAYADDMNTNYLNPFSEKGFEASPLNRVLSQAAPGYDWRSGSGHEIKLDYQSNVVNEVKNFGVSLSFANNTYTPTLTGGVAFYAANELYKTITYDENTAAIPTELNGSTVEFKNKQGQVVLKRTYGTVGTGISNGKYDTYYVYDDYGNLTYVLPPKMEATTEADIVIIKNQLNDLGYQYKYDQRNRLVEKKLPGKQWEFIVYDKLDREVATGPAASPFSNLTSVGWLITKYDAFSRPVITAWMPATTVTSATRIDIQSERDIQTANFSETKIDDTTGTTINGVAFRYTNVAWPTNLASTTYHVLTVNYYDDYNFPNMPTIVASIEGEPVYYNNTVKPQGLKTATWTRILQSSTTYANELNYWFYDKKARPIGSYTINHLGGYTYTDSKLDFTGKPEYIITYHKRLSGSTELKTKEAFTYSAQGRLLTQTHQIEAGTVELIASNTYDELGQLISKKVGNTIGTPTQNVNYTYNIRGWLKGINDINSLSHGDDPKDLFAFNINYNSIPSGISDVKALYNGNIAETQWKTNFDEGNLRTYGYQYDNLNRLKAAIYKKQGIVSNAYNESLTYDKNGNIMSLLRNGNDESTVTQIDNLTYSYGPSNQFNQLTKVVDNAPIVSKANGFVDSVANLVDDYSYDANGNMLKDLNKGIGTSTTSGITYNHLNLPTKITFGTAENIEYIYNAAGQKLQKIVTDGSNVTTTDYLGGYQYESGSLKFFPTAEGYVEPAGSSYKYIYQYKDHLGNVRLSYDKTLAIKEESNYYPFGLKHEGYNTVKIGVENKYKFQGQERQDELGLGWDSFKYRNYDYAIARFMSIDPLTEKYRDWGPYVFSGNRVVDAREIEGLEPDILFGSEKDALKNFGQQYNGKSIKQGVEYGTNVYRTTAADGGTYYYYEEPNVGNAASVKYPSTLFNEGERVSTVHAHGEYLEEYDNNNFSPPDKENADKRGVDNHIVTPDGSLKKYDVKTKKETVIDRNMPSDPKDPERKNKVAPNENPSPVKTKPIEPKKVDAKPDPQYHHGRIM